MATVGVRDHVELVVHAVAALQTLALYTHPPVLTLGSAPGRPAEQRIGLPTVPGEATFAFSATEDICGAVTGKGTDWIISPLVPLLSELLTATLT